MILNIPLVVLIMFISSILCVYCASLNDNKQVIKNNTSDNSYFSKGIHTNDLSKLYYPSKFQQTKKSIKILQNKQPKQPIEKIKNTNARINNLQINQSKSSEKNKLVQSIQGGQNFSGRNEARKKKEEKGIMDKVLPMMVMPFLISSSMIPMMLISLFFTMVKSALIGKIGIILMLVNMFTNRRNPGAATTHSLNMEHPANQVAMEHYGWHGDEEYGAYVNKRKKRGS